MSQNTYLLCVSLGVCLCGTVPRARAGDPQPWESPPAAAQTVLRIARSDDGTAFQDTGDVLVARATAPDLEVLPDGGMIAVFDRAYDADPQRTVLQCARSRADGKAWSPPRRVHVLRGNRSLRDARHPDLLATREGLRLYFTTTLSSGRRLHVRPNGRVLVSSAVGRDTFEFVLDPATRIRIDENDAHAIVAYDRGYTHLFAVVPSETGLRHRRSAEQFLSRDERRFARLRRRDGYDQLAPGSIVPMPGGLRYFTASEAGIVTLRSRDGRRWQPEAGVRLDHGWDPAVARRPDGSFLMIYCDHLKEDLPQAVALADPEPQPEVELEDGSWEDLAGVDEQSDEIDELHETPNPDAVALDAEPEPADPTDGPDQPETPDDETSADSAPGAVVPQSDEPSAPTEDSSLVAADAPPDSRSVEQPAERISLEEWKQSAGGLEHWDPAWSDGFAPLPDFQTKIDYFTWYRDHAVPDPPDNAYYAYMAFLPDPRDQPGDKPPWPEFHDMFNGTGYDGPPAPWDPAEHPEWNVTAPEVQALLAQYRRAVQHSSYAAPALTARDLSGESPEDEPLLAEILLPSLSAHRTLAKATLADAWRRDSDGKVSSKRMLDAFETTLRAASHMSQGATLIEELVGAAMRSLTYKNARWALKRDVFSANDLERALDTLQRHDRAYKDPADALRGEHAFAMDAVQYLFSPPAPDGTPKINPERVDRISEWFSPQDIALDRVKGMRPEEAYDSIDAFDAYHRQLTEMFRIGYPQVRAADVEVFTQDLLAATPLTELLMPNLSRYYQLKTRIESSRRATQLTYAVHVFRNRHGRWPDSLHELPPEFGDEMRTDPYTGDYFAYDLTDDGPRIYSLSENALDDGGIHSPRWDDNVPERSDSDDHVFWPPQPD